MRQATSTLTAWLLAREPCFSVDLFTFNLMNGAVYRWCSTETDVVANGVLWSAAGPAIQRSKWSVKNTTEVPELEIKLFSTGADLSAGNLKTMLHDGILDGAYIQLDRAFMPTYGDASLGTVTLFGGRAGKIEITGLGATITCIASNVLMQQYMPRNTFQLGCIHTLYDAGCTLDRASHTAAFTVDGANPITVISVESMGAGGVFVLGTLTVTDGAGIGQRRTVQAFDTVSGRAVACAYPLLVVPAHGDHFTLTQGCDKTLARCTALGNAANFRGFPAIPPASSGI